MRSPRERAVWTICVIVMVALAAAAWWTAGQWLPHAGPWAKKAWRTVTRPPPPSGRDGAAAARTPGNGSPAAETPPARKCVQHQHTTYTDQPCPPGSHEQLLDPARGLLPH